MPYIDHFYGKRGTKQVLGLWEATIGEKKTLRREGVVVHGHARQPIVIRDLQEGRVAVAGLCLPFSGMGPPLQATDRERLWWRGGRGCRPLLYCLAKGYSI